MRLCRQRKKVVVLEDLGAQFGLRSKDVLERVQRLEAMGRLTGVIDDRGKFICITPEEMDKVRWRVQCLLNPASRRNVQSALTAAGCPVHSRHRPCIDCRAGHSKQRVRGFDRG